MRQGLATQRLKSPPAQLITEPASEPLTLAEAKEHLRVEHAINDTLITGLITGARVLVEKMAWRGFVTQTWEITLRCFPYEGWLDEQGGVELPRGNLTSVTSVIYVDTSGAPQTLASSEYVLDTANVPGRIMPAYGKTWPSTREQWDAVKIRYVVGWAAGSVPTPIKQAILLVLSQLYEERAVEVVGSIASEIQYAADQLLAPYRLVTF